MGMPKHAATVDANQAEIVKTIREVPVLSVEILKLPVDIAVGYQGRTYLFEIKVPKRPKRRSKRQRDFIAGWTGHCSVVTSAEEILAELGLVREAARIRNRIPG